MSFSVLMSIYKNEKVTNFKLAIDSVLKQTLKPDQIVLVIDGPLYSELEDTIQLYVESSPIEITLVRLIENVGLGKALNRGMEKCRNSIVARMDTDDIATKNRFSVQIPLLADYDIVGSVVEEFVCEPGDRGKVRYVPEMHDDIKKFSKYRNPINHPTLVYKKSVFESLEGYRSIVFFEDYDFILRAIKRDFKIYNVQESLLDFRFDTKTYSRRRGFKYFNREIDFYRVILIEKLIPRHIAVCMLLFKPIIRMLPTFVIKNIYDRRLRNEK